MQKIAKQKEKEKEKEKERKNRREDRARESRRPDGYKKRGGDDQDDAER